VYVVPGAWLTQHAFSPDCNSSPQNTVPGALLRIMQTTDVICDCCLRMLSAGVSHCSERLKSSEKRIKKGWNKSSQAGGVSTQSRVFVSVLQRYTPD